LKSLRLEVYSRIYKGTITLFTSGVSPKFLPVTGRALGTVALLPNVEPLESGGFRLSQIRWAGDVTPNFPQLGLEPSRVVAHERG
jgi:hypothetical protein